MANMRITHNLKYTGHVIAIAQKTVNNSLLRYLYILKTTFQTIP